MTVFACMGLKALITQKLCEWSGHSSDLNMLIQAGILKMQQVQLVLTNAAFVKALANSCSGGVFIFYIFFAKSKAFYSWGLWMVCILGRTPSVCYMKPPLQQTWTMTCIPHVECFSLGRIGRGFAFSLEMHLRSSSTVHPHPANSSCRVQQCVLSSFSLSLCV